MKTLSRALIIAVFVLAGSCAPTGELPKVAGDSATIQTKHGSSYTGELIFFRDEIIFLAVKDISRSESGEAVLHGMRMRDIQSIKIEGYANRKWQTSLILFQVVPTGIFVATAASVDSENAGPALLLFGLPTLLTYGLLELSTPVAPEVRRPLTPESMADMKKYMRFPEGLTTTQFEIFLQGFREKDVIYVD